ncbi:MAG: EAL domain-containing protein [Candidatus Igneacidithiobacillus chanchocoensis]
MTERVPPHILIVEDDAPSRQLLRRRLERQGMQVTEAADGFAALAALQNGNFSAVILDIGLPGMDGLRVLEELRKRHSPTALPVLMATAFDADVHLPRAMELGANDFVNKPIDFAILQARLQTQLRIQEADHGLRRALAQQELILEGSNDGIWEWDVPGDQIRHSPRWHEVLRESSAPRESSSADWLQRIHPSDRPRVEAELQATFSGTGRLFSTEYRIQDGCGSYRWILTRGALRRDASGQVQQAAGTHSDISALRYCDRLSGLPISQAVLDNLQLLQRRQGSFAWALLSLRVQDPNGFLQHLPDPAAVLQAVAEKLRQVPALQSLAVDDSPFAFLLLLHDSDPQQNFTDSLRQIDQLFAAGVQTPFGIFSCQVFLGLRRDQIDPLAAPAEVLRQARGASRLARESGRRLVHFDADVEAKLRRLEVLSQELVQAVADGAVQPWWQVFVRSDGRLAGFEVLARWRRADGTQVSPAEFIPLIEKAGLLETMTWQLLQQAMAQFREWLAAGLAEEDHYFAVNFSPSLLTESLVPRLLEQLRQFQLQPRQLCVEMTESSEIVDFGLARGCLTELAAAGFRLALDDFGTGFASLNTLHRLPFHTLKIDQSFVRQMFEGDETISLIAAIIAMGKSLGLKVVAEGVETAEQLQRLSAMGVDQLQGYYFAAARPGEEQSRSWTRYFAMPREQK